MVYPIHNHLASIAPIAYPIHRKASLNKQIRVQIIIMARSSMSIAQILIAIRKQYPEVMLTQKDVSNILQKTRLIELDGKSPIEWLMIIC